MWVHDARCQDTVILWFQHGHREQDWTGVYQCCPYRCAGLRLPSGVTHAEDCPFWRPDDRLYLAILIDRQLELDTLG